VKVEFREEGGMVGEVKGGVNELTWSDIVGWEGDRKWMVV
jgi:hypothetical protein